MLDIEFKSNYCKEFMYGHIAVLFSLSSVFLYSMFEYINGEPWVEIWAKYIYVSCVFFAGPVGILAFINSAYHQAKSHTQVTIEKKGIEGLSIFGKKTFLKFDEIVKIHKPKWTGMDLISIVDTHNQEIRILGTMSHFGFLLEYVRDHSPNIKYVDFGGLDDDPSIWRNDRPFYS